MSDDAKLPDPMEALLNAWPVAQRPELDWEAFADATVTHALADDHAYHDERVVDDLLAAPALEPEPGEPSKPRLAAVPSPEDEELSLTDIARASLDDDDPEETRELAQLAFSHAHRERVSRPSYPDVPRTSEIRATPRPPSPVPVEPKAEVVAIERGKSGGGGRWGLAMAVLGIAAAAALLVLRPGQPEQPATASAPAAEIPAETRNPSAERAQGAVAAATPKKAKGAAPSLTVEELKPEAPSAPAPKLALAAKPAATQEPAPSAKPKAEEEPDDPRLVPAANADNVPLEPSTGAALAAVGRVMGGAKACVAGHSSASNATIVFASTGKVQSVAISGPAAGTAAEGCIRNALSGARVAPFAKPTFTVRVPIRP